MGGGRWEVGGGRLGVGRWEVGVGSGSINIYIQQKVLINLK